MTPEEFLDHIGQGGGVYRLKDKARFNLIRAKYQVYVRAYREQATRGETTWPTPCPCTQWPGENRTTVVDTPVSWCKMKKI